MNVSAKKMVDSVKDGKLRGMRLPAPRFVIKTLPPELQQIRGYRNIQTYFPALNKLFRLNKFQSTSVWLDLPRHITRVEMSEKSGFCTLTLEAEDKQEVKEAHYKVTHLLDPIRWIKGDYSLPKEAGLPWHSRTWTPAWHKIQDPWNQAYVQTLAMYALSKLREKNISPHFNLFYGAFCAKADTYRFDLVDDYEQLRGSPTFWKGPLRQLFTLSVVNSTDPSVPVPVDVVEELLTPPEYACSEEDEEEELKSEGTCDKIELESLESASLNSREFESEEEDDDYSSEEESNYTVLANLPNFPVMLIFSEKNEDTMDSLLDSDLHTCKPGSEEWETMWSAWIFQIIAACCVMQKFFGMTHNDLHTNNILWTPTDIPFLYYKSADGTVWEIPTFGKLFRLIDFGRSIFTINGTLFVSDDFRNGNDAGGQYKFPPLSGKKGEQIPPNPSFDLSRLSVSLFEALFPQKPADHSSKRILSEEEGLVIRETVSPLYNCLWSWLIDDEDRNILMEPDGSERFPDFDLYNHIAAHVHGAEPAAQIHKDAFARFKVAAAPQGDHVYSLFV